MSKPKKNVSKSYLYGLILGIITGFMISNTLLSIRMKNRKTSCVTHLTISSNNFKLQQRKPAFTGNAQIRKKLLLVCVLTTRDHLESRALAIYRTWASGIRGDIIFVIGGANNYTGPLPVITLENIADKEYPPRRKSFAMLKYISDYYGNKYRWFMRADDDMFVYSKKLSEMLSRVDDHNLIYMGHPGTGSLTELGNIGLHGDEPYCMGGTGVVLSGVLLNGIAGHLLECLNHTESNHEDSEIGRCIYKQYGLSCTRAEEFKQLFYQNYVENSGKWFVESVMSWKRLTLHPMKEQSYIYRTYISHQTQTIWRLENKMDNLIKDVGLFSIDVVNIADWRVHRETDDSLLHNLNVNYPWSCDYKHNFYSLRSKDFVEPSSFRGRHSSFLTARHVLVDFIRQTNSSNSPKLCLLSYRRLVPKNELQQMLFTEDKYGTINQFLVVQRFTQLRFRESEKTNITPSSVNHEKDE